MDGHRTRSAGQTGDGVQHQQARPAGGEADRPAVVDELLVLRGGRPAAGEVGRRRVEQQQPLVQQRAAQRRGIRPPGGRSADEILDERGRSVDGGQGLVRGCGPAPQPSLDSRDRRAVVPGLEQPRLDGASRRGDRQVRARRGAGPQQVPPITQRLGDQLHAGVHASVVVDLDSPELRFGAGLQL